MAVSICHQVPWLRSFRRGLRPAGEFLMIYSANVRGLWGSLTYGMSPQTVARSLHSAQKIIQPTDSSMNISNHPTSSNPNLFSSHNHLWDSHLITSGQPRLRRFLGVRLRRLRLPLRTPEWWPFEISRSQIYCKYNNNQRYIGTLTVWIWYIIYIYIYIYTYIHKIIYIYICIYIKYTARMPDSERSMPNGNRC